MKKILVFALLACIIVAHAYALSTSYSKNLGKMPASQHMTTMNSALIKGTKTTSSASLNAVFSMQREQFAKIDEAIKKKDYAAWKKAISANKNSQQLANKITAENFPLYLKLLEAQKKGDYSTVLKLRKQLGLQSAQQFNGWNAQISRVPARS